MKRIMIVTFENLPEEISTKEVRLAIVESLWVEHNVSSLGVDVDEMVVKSSS